MATIPCSPANNPNFCCLLLGFDAESPAHQGHLLASSLLSSESFIILLVSENMPSKAGGSIAAWQIAAVVVLLYLAQLVLKAIYRITLHPLAKFPGPILAALSYKYEFYFDGIKGGQYTNEIARLHQIYGTRWIFSLRSCTEC